MKKDESRLNNRQNKGITLIALIIAIIILLILAGVTLAMLGNRLDIFTNAKQIQMEAEMEEQLTLSMHELQMQKQSDATLDDVTQEWAGTHMNEYNCKVKDSLQLGGKKILMEKHGVKGKFLIDENLNIRKIDEEVPIVEYETLTKNGDSVKILITITDDENGLEQIEFPNGSIVNCNGDNEISVEYDVKLGEEFKIKIKSKNGEINYRTILVKNYYYKVIKHLGNGIEINNATEKVEYNKPYNATITTQNGEALDSLIVTMGGKKVEVDKATGTINVENVTGDIIIKAFEKRDNIEFKGDTYIVSNIAQSDFLGVGKEWTVAVQVYINREQQSRVYYMDIFGNHVDATGFTMQFSGDSTWLGITGIGLIDYSPYYDEWVDIVVTSKNATNKLYVNNELVLQSNGQHSPYGNIMIGNGYMGSGRAMVGKISALKLWKKELSMEEINRLNLLEENTTIESSEILQEAVFSGIESIEKIGTLVGNGYYFNKNN